LRVRLSLNLSYRVLLSFCIVLSAFGDAQTLKTLTANTYLLRDTQWGDLKPYIPSRAKLIPLRAARTGSHLVNFQEVWSPDLREQFVRDMTNLGYPYHAQQSSISPLNIGTACGAVLTAPFLYSAYRTINPGRRVTRRRWLRRVLWGAGAATAGTGTYVGFGSYEHWLRMNNGLISFSKYPIRKILHVNFPQIAAPEEFFVNKGAVLMQVEMPGGTRVWNLNTHLPSTDDFSPRQVTARRRALQTLLGFVDRETAENDNLLVAGDMNVHLFRRLGKKTFDPKTFSIEYTMLRNAFGDDLYHKFFGIHDPAVTDTSANPLRTGDEPDKFIDYLFARGPAFGNLVSARIIHDGTVNEEERRELGITDHPPTSADHWFVEAEIEIL